MEDTASDALAVKTKAWRGATRVYTSGGDVGTHEERFAREVVDRVKLERRRADGGMRVEASGKVAEVLREGLVGLGCSVVERTAAGDASRVVVVGIVGGKEETVGERELYVNRVGVVWLVDAHWTLAQYAEWVGAEGLGSHHGSLWSVVHVDDVLGVLSEVIPSLKKDLSTVLATELGELKGELEGLVRSAKGADVDEERRGVLVRGIMKAIGAVDGKVRAIEEAIELSTPPKIDLLSGNFLVMVERKCEIVYTTTRATSADLSLPTWLEGKFKLSGNGTGKVTISGTPTAAGTYTFGVSVTGPGGATKLRVWETTITVEGRF